jgi:hypothetical protein
MLDFSAEMRPKIPITYFQNRSIEKEASATESCFPWQFGDAPITEQMPAYERTPWAEDTEVILPFKTSFATSMGEVS